MPSQANQPLPEGTQLENYRILRVLATGGFSFVYLAHDENDKPVAVKEYLPSTLAVRINGDAYPRIPEADLAKFRYGMKCFFEEGRALAGLQHPNVVRVLNFFRANETVYLVMRYERGRTLQEHIKSRRGALEEDWIRKTFTQLLNGLREVHSNKLLHLDIKPGNVYVRNDGTPLLIDFGAARQTLSAEGMALPPTYTPGFASPEQHARRELLGPWSDIYSVGATMYACLAAAAPQPADQRLEKDLVVPARRTWAGKYSAGLLDIVDWCLRMDHMERPQSVFALQKTLTGEKEPDYRGKAPLFDRVRDMLEARMKYAIVQESRLGARKMNQDRIGHWRTPESLLMVVADGMGGHLHGEVAANLAADLFGTAFQREARPRLADPAQFLAQAVAAAHAQILGEAHKRGMAEAPRTVIVACVVQEGRAYWMHVGDCRLYLFRKGRLVARTRDHTRVQQLVDEGRIREEAVVTHPERNRLLQCLGGYQAPRPETTADTVLEKDDIVLLCSDGFWGPLTQRQMLNALLARELKEAVPELVSLAEARAGHECDNVSVLAIAWGEEMRAPAVAQGPSTLPYYELPTDVQDLTATDPDFLRVSDDDIDKAIAEIKAALRKNVPPRR